jgi:FtsH-binding integral membrane protein
MSAETLRRISFVAMIVAIVAGTVSLWLLFTAPAPNFVPATISVIALVIGMIVDRQARRLEDRNAG